MAKIIGSPTPNILWQERGKNDNSLVWRYSENPIITKKSDGIHREITKEPIKFISEDEETGIFGRGFDLSISSCKAGKCNDTNMF